MMAFFRQSIEVECSHLISAEHSLQHAIALTQKSKQIRAISSLANPYIETVNMRVAALLTHEYPDVDGGSLLSNAISEASDTYCTAAELGRRIEDNENEYLTTIISRCADMRHYTVHGKVGQKTARWVPFETNLLDWVAQRKAQKLVFTLRENPVDDRLAWVIFVIGRILTIDRAGIIQRVIEQHGAGECHVD